MPQTYHPQTEVPVALSSDEIAYIKAVLMDDLSNDSTYGNSPQIAVLLNKSILDKLEKAAHPVSITQLPSGGWEKAFDAWEKDYKARKANLARIIHENSQHPCQSDYVCQ